MLLSVVGKQFHSRCQLTCEWLLVVLLRNWSKEFGLIFLRHSFILKIRDACMEHMPSSPPLCAYLHLSRTCAAGRLHCIHIELRTFAFLIEIKLFFSDFFSALLRHRRSTHKAQVTALSLFLQIGIMAIVQRTIWPGSVLAFFALRTKTH